MSLPKAFYDAVRPLFGGRLNQHQVEGIAAIVEYGLKWGYSLEYIAYCLATSKRETGNWMVPIREGASRFGPTYSDASAKRAVASLKAKRIISTNYALPTGPFGQSYYGRGLIQITWYDNYKKFGELLQIALAENPDLALEMGVSLDILYLGMRDGMFRSKNKQPIKLGDFDLTSYKDVWLAREVVNGDKNKTYGGKTNIGDIIATDHFKFLAALKELDV